MILDYPARFDVVDIPHYTRFCTSQVVVWDFFHLGITPRKLKIARENRHSQKEGSLPTIILQGLS